MEEALLIKEPEFNQINQLYDECLSYLQSSDFKDSFKLKEIARDDDDIKEPIYESIINDVKANGFKEIPKPDFKVENELPQKIESVHSSVAELKSERLRRLSSTLPKIIITQSDSSLNVKKDLPVVYEFQKPKSPGVEKKAPVKNMFNRNPPPLRNRSAYGDFPKRLVSKGGSENVALISNVPFEKIRLLNDTFHTLINLRWRWIVIGTVVVHFGIWLVFAAFWYVTALAHYDFEPDPPNRPCITGGKDFVTIFLASVEAQTTIGFGDRTIDEECPESIFLFIMQLILGTGLSGVLTCVVYAKLTRPEKLSRDGVGFSKKAVYIYLKAMGQSLFIIREIKCEEDVSTASVVLGAEKMESRIMITILGLLAFTTAQEKLEKKCNACIDNICYDIQNVTQNPDSDCLSIIKENYVVDRVDNLVHFVSADSLEIQTLNLTDKATKTVFTLNQKILSLAFNESSRDLYYSLNNGDVFKYNLLTNQAVSILKPVNDDSQRPQVLNLVILSNKLFATKFFAINEDFLEKPRLFEYVPEESKFKMFAPLKDVDLYDAPIADLRGDIYFRTPERLNRLRAGTNSIDLVHENRVVYGTDNIGEIHVYGTDNHGVAYFVPGYGKKLYRLAPYSDDLILVGSLHTYSIKSINFDKYNNLIYPDTFEGLCYLKASSEKCELRLPGRYDIEIVKLTD